jgi:ATP-dependent DNA ligase
LAVGTLDKLAIDPPTDENGRKLVEKMYPLIAEGIASRAFHSQPRIDSLRILRVQGLNAPKNSAARSNDAPFTPCGLWRPSSTAGAGDNECRVIPPSMPRFDPMKLAARAAPFDDPGFIFELKYDGFRALAHVEGGE